MGAAMISSASASRWSGLFLFLWILAALPAAARDLPEFMVFTYEVELTEKAVQLLAASDFNTVYGPADKLGLCKKYGLKLMIPHPGQEAAAGLRGNPDVWGYDIMDEPISLKQVHAAAESVIAYRAADPTHLTFVNLNQKAGHWIPFFIDTVKPDFLSYDEYPWWYGGIYSWFAGADPLYVKLEQHRDEAIAADLPLTVWREVNIQRNVPGSPDRNWITPPNNEPNIRLNVYATLAYGAKGILWFFGPLLFDKTTGDLNETGRQVAAINHELKWLGPALFPLVSTGVFHSPPAPKGSREPTPDNWVQPVGKNLLIGAFRDSTPDFAAQNRGPRDMERREYVLVVNKSADGPNEATLQFRLFLEKVDRVEMLDKKTGVWTPLAITEVKDTRDHARIYNIDNIEPPVLDHITYNRKALPPKELAFFELYHTYRPPYQAVSLKLRPGDGELVRVTLKEGKDIPDPR
jgi:hypothetical protein